LIDCYQIEEIKPTLNKATYYQL